MMHILHVDNSAVGNDRPPSVNVNHDVNAVFKALHADGLKVSTKAANTDMNVLGGCEEVFPKNIGAYVEVKLEREKDRRLPDRVKLADEVRDTVLTELRNVFQGDPFEAKTVLYVRVVLVSDASSLGHRWMAENGVGAAKLTLAYCLLSFPSGRVAMGNQLFTMEDCDPVAKDACFREFTAAVVRSMARDLAGDISEEVSSEIVRWKQRQQVLACE